MKRLAIASSLVATIILSIVATNSISSAKTYLFYYAIALLMAIIFSNSLLSAIKDIVLKQKLTDD